MRLARDLGITRIDEVANASVDQLTQIWSVGEWTARVMKGSAQGHSERLKSEVRDARIFVSMPGDVTEKVAPQEIAEQLEATIEELGYDVESDTLNIGFPKAIGRVDGDSLGEFLGLWKRRRENITLHGFETLFDEHAQPADAFRHRRECAVRWATDVAVPVATRYSGFLIRDATREEVSVSVGLIQRGHEADVDHNAGMDIDEASTYVSDPSGHDDEDVPVGADGKWDVKSNKTADPDRHWDVGATPGREGDVADPADAYLTMRPNDQDEPRLDRNDLEGADPGGDGDPSSGPKSWSTGS